MARKKGSNRDSNRPQIINNIASVNMEIDYDKLAEAIVKAEEKAENNKIERHMEDFRKLSFKEKIKDLFFGKKSTDGRYTTSLLAFLTSSILKVLAALCFIFFIGVSYGIITVCAQLDWSSVARWIGNILGIASVILMDIAILLYTFFLNCSAREVMQEKDKNFIVAVFSGLTGFVALIVAIIALFKGVA